MYDDFKNIHEFLKEFSKREVVNTNPQKELVLLKNAKISKSECLYVLEFSSNQMIFKKGFEEFLGYDSDEVTVQRYLDRIHPKDIDLVAKIAKASIVHSDKHPGHNKDNVLYLSYRIQRKDGDYTKVLSQSQVFQRDERGRLVSILVRVIDISFLMENDLVKYNFMAGKLDQEAFKAEIHGDNFTLFTSRELEVIREMAKGTKNQEIAEILGISVHTVATHRKKIMKKSRSHSADELLLFCRKNGVL